jgi:uncharacterized protein
VKCPRDQQETETRVVEDAEVELCPQCGGMYLDRGELNKVAGETAGDLEFSTIDQDAFQHDDDSGPIHCPKDPDVLMKKVEFVTGTNIILDFCERCLGFWIDGRELVRINNEVERLNDAALEVDDPPLVRLSQFFWNLPFPR